MASHVILVVDDEGLVIEYIEHLLKGRGYELASFTDPVKALGFFSENFNRIDLIISDVKMPELSGPELAKEAIRLKPGISIILLSAYSETLPEVVSMENVKGVLEKPLMKTDLLQVVEGVLAGGRR